MLVLAVLKPSTSPSPMNLPPLIDTVALARVTLSGSNTETDGDNVTVWPWRKLTGEVNDVSVGGMCAMLIVVFCAVLRLFEAEPSLSTQVTVRVGLLPALLGF